VVLGMIGLGAKSGYEIKQMVQISIRFFWTISQAQIYPSLRRLEGAGLLASHADPRNKRRPRTFTLTPAGSEALRTWLIRDQPMPFELRDIAMVKLFFADGIDPAHAHSLLAAVRHRSHAQVAALQAIAPTADELAAQTGKDHPQLTLQMGIAYHQAMIHLCDAFEHSHGGTAKGKPTKAHNPPPTV
jgi:PadR family transcriptional regulator AphA